MVNKFGQTHDMKNLFVSDGSQFTSGAACNPTLTIVALAIRQAENDVRHDEPQGGVAAPPSAAGGAEGCRAR